MTDHERRMILRDAPKIVAWCVANGLAFRNHKKTTVTPYTPDTPICPKELGEKLGKTRHYVYMMRMAGFPKRAASLNEAVNWITQNGFSIRNAKPHLAHPQ